MAGSFAGGSGCPRRPDSPRVCPRRQPRPQASRPRGGMDAGGMDAARCDALRILGLAEGAAHPEVRAAFRALTVKW